MKVPLFSSTPGGAAVSELHVKDSSLNPDATPFVKAALPTNQDCQSSGVSFPASATETMMTRLTASIDSIAITSNLPPLDVVKFSGTPSEYFRFKARFEKMVDTQNISEAQKCHVYCNFLMAKLEVLWWVSKERPVGCW